MHPKTATLMLQSALLAFLIGITTQALGMTFLEGLVINLFLYFILLAIPFAIYRLVKD